jgi:hypothetical protein
VKEYVVCTDLGKRRDRAVHLIMQDVAQIVPGVKTLGTPDRILHTYVIVYIQQFFGKSYPQLVAETRNLMGTKSLVHNSDLLVDGNGVGDSVVDDMRLVGLMPIPIIAGGGNQVNEVYDEAGKIFADTPMPTKLKPLRTLKEIHVPKIDLVDAGALLAQQGRVELARGLRWAEEFQRQMQDFKDRNLAKRKNVNVAPKYAAEHDEVHDDIVFCYLMGCWWFSRHVKDEDHIPERPLAGAEMPKAGDWNPYDFE